MSNLKIRWIFALKIASEQIIMSHNLKSSCVANKALVGIVKTSIGVKLVQTLTILILCFSEANTSNRPIKPQWIPMKM